MDLGISKIRTETDKKKDDRQLPKVVAGALILHKGKMLLIRSDKWWGKWTVPGGKIEWGETIESALRREVMEEVGLDVNVMKFLGVQEAIMPREFYKPAHFIMLNYLCRVNVLPGQDPVVKTDGREVREFTWVKPRDVLRLSPNLEPYAVNLIKIFLATSGEKKATKKERPARKRR